MFAKGVGGEGGWQQTEQTFASKNRLISQILGRITKESIGDRPNTVSESTVSNTELSEFFALTEFRGENSVSSSRPMICV